MLYENVEQTIEETKKALVPFNELEKLFRTYYQMEHQKGLFTDKEYHDFLKKNRQNRFIFQNDELDVVDYKSTDSDVSISIQKHCRYLPPRKHTHDFIEFFYIFTGNCTHECEETSYNLSAGDFCFWQPHLPHSICSYSDDFLALNIMIKKENFENLVFPLLKKQNVLSYYFRNIIYGEYSSPLIIFKTDGDRQIQYLISCMYQESKKKNDYYGELLGHYLNEAIIYLLRNHLTNLQVSSSPTQGNMTVILQYIREHYQSVTLQKICQEFNYSPAYFSRLIKKSFGKTFSQIINDCRLSRTQWLLENTEMPIQDISLEVGCTDSSHLYRIFRENFNVTPLKYRQLHGTNVHPHISFKTPGLH